MSVSKSIIIGCFRGAVFYLYSTGNPQIYCVSLNDCYIELLFRIVKSLLAMIFLLGSSLFLLLRQPIGRTTSLTSCPRVLFILNIKGGSTRTIYFIIMTSVLKIVACITSKRFGPKYIFHHHDVSFKISSMYNVKEYMPQNHDQQNMVMETG